MKHKLFLSFALVITCATLITCALILVKPSVLFKNANGISVKGFATQKVVSDAAEWNANIQVESQSETGAYDAAKAEFKKVLDAMKEAGANEGEISSSNVSVSAVMRRNENGYETNELVCYRASVSIGYTTGDVYFANRLSRVVSELKGQGVKVDSNYPKYFYTGLEDLKIELLGKAVENATQRAEAMTQSSGSKLGKISSASQGVFQITRPLSSETSDYGMYDLSSIEKEIKCVVSVKFEVE